MIEHKLEDLLAWLSSTTFLGFPANEVVAYALLMPLVIYPLLFLILMRRNFEWYRELFDSTDWVEVHFVIERKRSRLQRMVFPFTRFWISDGEYRRNRHKFKKTGGRRRAKKRGVKDASSRRLHEVPAE